ncbi:MAG TPA: TetR/AcrR family transcriptional regulator [Acidimicrobiales bacterium]|nr:TetR/AcrR family transcriptional regulator [Acidimicrobiales bacterium]
MRKPPVLEQGSKETGRRRKPAKGDLREAALLRTASELLSHRPWSAVSVDDLARGAGISRSAFYFYFDSREAVLFAIAAQAEGWLMQADEIWLRRTDESPYDSLRRAICRNFDLWREHGPVLRAVIDAQTTDPALVEFRRQWAEHFVSAIAAQIEREQAAGLALEPPPAVRDLARTLAGMTERVMYESTMVSLSKAVETRLAATLSTIWCRSIYGTKPRS